MKNFFSDREPKFIKLSAIDFTDKNPESNFKKLFKICNKKSDLLFLVENSFGKKYGGFTKCVFDRYYDEWKSDERKKSFIFSLDCDFKQLLKGK